MGNIILTCFWILITGCSCRFDMGMKHFIFAALAAVFVNQSAPAQADLASDAPDTVVGFVESNLIATFYHELGHALIDIEQLPVFGQEEDAADVLSVVLIDAYYDEETAVQITYDAAYGFLGYADEQAETGEEPAFWDTHGPDLQRYYTLVCLFYGADAEEREDVAQELGLPQERAETCEEEFELAADSWGGVLDDIAANGGGTSMELGELDDSTPSGALTSQVIKAEVEAFNAGFQLSSPLTVEVASCGEANAFYDPNNTTLTVCTEYGDSLADMAPAL